MRNFILLFLFLLAVPLVNVGCSTAPVDRITQVQTLKDVGAAGKSGIDTAVTLLKAGKITVTQFTKIANFYDTQFQPAYTTAVSAVQSDLSPASPELISLAAQLAGLLAEVYPTK